MDFFKSVDLTPTTGTGELEIEISPIALDLDVDSFEFVNVEPIEPVDFGPVEIVPTDFIGVSTSIFAAVGNDGSTASSAQNSVEGNAESIIDLVVIPDSGTFDFG